MDTETAGIEWADSVRLVQFGNAELAFAVRADTMRGRRLIAETLYVSGACTLVLHNAPFDLHALQRIGVDAVALWPRCIDTYVLAHVADPAALHGLKPQSVARLGADSADEQHELKAAMRRHRWTWATVPLLVLLRYAGRDVHLTWLLHEHYTGRLSARQLQIAQREMEVEAAVWRVELRGMRLDAEYARDLDARWTREQRQLEHALSRYLVGPGELKPEAARTAKRNGGYLHGPPEPEYLDNPNSTIQVAGALVQLGWTPSARTATGRAQVDKDTLEALAGAYPLVDSLLEYRRIGKWRKAYVEACLLTMDTQQRVHARYNTLGAVTGRMSCSRPPLQQLPKGGGGEVRRLFIASPGNLIASVDYSAVEFRLAGALSGERRIIDVYTAGGDWYQQVADDLKISRPQAKVFCLAILYGARGRRIAAALGFQLRTGNRLVREFWRRYPTLAEWSKRMESDAEQGLPPESGWGRTLRPHAAYAAGNAVIQGTAAEVMKDGLLRLRDAQLDGLVVAIVHDEVVLDVPEQNASTLTSEVARVLSDLHTFACPLVAEGTVYGASWGAGYAA